MSYWMLYKLPCESSLMHYMLKVDLCSIWKENLHNSCTGAAMLPSGAHSVHLYGCWSQPPACCSEHSPIVQKTSNFQPCACGCMPETSTPRLRNGKSCTSINHCRQVAKGSFFFFALFFLVGLLWSQPRPVFHINTEGSWILFHSPFIRD